MTDQNPIGLRYDRQSNVIGKAPGKLLKGGLGALGVGVMWFDGDDTDPAYADVPYCEFKGGEMYAGRPPLPADHPDRDRDELVEAAYRCVECNRPWVIFAVEGEPTDGVVDPRKCRFCGAGDARRIR